MDVLTPTTPGWGSMYVQTQAAAGVWWRAHAWRAAPHAHPLRIFMIIRIHTVVTYIDTSSSCCAHPLRPCLAG